jgi:RecB family exonuclease
MGLSLMRQSMIKDYCFCPKLFRYKYVDKTPPAFRNASAIHGIVIHRLLHMTHTEDWTLDASAMYPEVFEFQEQHSDESHIPIFFKNGRDETLAKFTAEATEMLNNYRARDYNREGDVALSESSFTVKIGRAGVFTGTIDQVRRHEHGAYELVDFKTSKFAPDQAFLDTDYQFGIYAYALRHGVFQASDGDLGMLVIPPDKLTITWYHLRHHITYKRATNGRQAGEEKGDPRRCTKRTTEQLAELKRDLSKIVSNIHRGSFARNPSYSTCPVCPYTSICVEDSKGEALNRNQRNQVEKLLEENHATQV